jgi:hypothetical protein
MLEENRAEKMPSINVTSFLPSSAVPTKDQEKSDNTDDEEREDTTKMETF